MTFLYLVLLSVQMQSVDTSRILEKQFQGWTYPLWIFRVTPFPVLSAETEVFLAPFLSIYGVYQSARMIGVLPVTWMSEKLGAGIRVYPAIYTRIPRKGKSLQTLAFFVHAGWRWNRRNLFLYSARTGIALTSYRAFLEQGPVLGPGIVIVYGSRRFAVGSILMTDVGWVYREEYFLNADPDSWTSTSVETVQSVQEFRRHIGMIPLFITFQVILLGRKPRPS